MDWSLGRLDVFKVPSCWHRTGIWAWTCPFLFFVYCPHHSLPLPLWVWSSPGMALCLELRRNLQDSWPVTGNPSRNKRGSGSACLAGRSSRGGGWSTLWRCLHKPNLFGGDGSSFPGPSPPKLTIIQRDCQQLGTTGTRVRQSCLFISIFNWIYWGAIG